MMTTRRRSTSAARAAAAILACSITGQAVAEERSIPDTAAAAVLEETIRLIHTRYVHEIPTDSLVQRAQARLVESLDPYSGYLDEPAWINLHNEIAGSFGGIGVFLAPDSTSSTVRVKALLLHSPAAKSGIRPGDVIVAVDGHAVDAPSIDDVRGLIMGPAGSKVAITLRRAGAAEETHVSVERALIDLPTVRGMRRTRPGAWDYLLEAGRPIAYVRIASFTKHTAVEVDSALANVARRRAEAMVIDLRDNWGGLLTAAVEIADMFLDSGPIVTTRDRGGQDEVRVAEPGVATKVPLVLLVNGQTMSAAEILAAALQDRGRATIVGERSFGKGVGQQLLPLGSGLGGLRLTTFTYTRPSGRPIERHLAGADTTQGGIWPDAGMAVALEPRERERWQQSLSALDVLSGLGEGSVDPEPFDPKLDPVLARAITFLEERLARNAR